MVGNLQAIGWGGRCCDRRESRGSSELGLMVDGTWLMGPKVHCSPFLRVSSGNLNQPSVSLSFLTSLYSSPLSRPLHFEQSSLTNLKTTSIQVSGSRSGRAVD